MILIVCGLILYTILNTSKGENLKALLFSIDWVNFAVVYYWRICSEEDGRINLVKAIQWQWFLESLNYVGHK